MKKFMFFTGVLISAFLGISTVSAQFVADNPNIIDVTDYEAVANRANDGKVKVVIRASGSEGKEKLSLKLKGETFKTWQLSPEVKNYSVRIDREKISGQTLNLVYNNDRDTGPDKRNVFVDWLNVNGERYQTEASTVKSRGSWSNNSCKIGFKQSETLHCNGWFKYSLKQFAPVVSPPVTPPVTPRPIITPPVTVTPRPIITPPATITPRPITPTPTITPKPINTPTPTPTITPGPTPHVGQNKILAYDTAWELLTHADSEAEIIEYFDYASAKGYDGVLLSLLNHSDGWQDGKSAMHGELQSYEQSGRLIINPTHLDYTDRVLDLAHAKGLRVGLVAAWGQGYLHDNVNSSGADSCNKGPLNASNAYAFGNQLGAALGTHPAIEFFITGGDNLCHTNHHLLEDGNIWRNMARALNDNGANKITYHTAPANYDWGKVVFEYSQLYMNEDWLSFLFPETATCANEVTSGRTLTELAKLTDKDIFAAEMRYFAAGPANWCDEYSPGSPVGAAEIAADVDVVISSGAIGYAYGDWDRWLWCEPNPTGRAGLSYLANPGQAHDPCPGQDGIKFTFDSAGESALFDTIRN